jgi:glycine/D-amino acid oxidase-like deaminating enzyme
MARILVVGAGIVGLSVARSALRRGHAVTLIEQGEVPNPHAASFDQHRMIRLHYGAAEGYTRMVGHAFAAWDDLWQELGVRHFADSGALSVSIAAGDYTGQTLVVFRRLGIRHELLTAAEVERLCPQLQLPQHARGLLAAPGGPLFADRIVRDLARLVVQRGATVLERTRAVAVDEGAGTVTTESGAVLQGDFIVVAAGAWLPGLLPAEYGAAPTMRQMLCYVEAPPQHRDAWARGPAIVVLGDRSVYTLPPLAGTGLKFGSSNRRRPGSPAEGFDEGLDQGRRVIDDFGPYLRDPQDYRPLRMQVGYYVMDDSRRFALRHKGRRLVVTNCDGQMFKFGPLLGERIVAALDGEQSFDALAGWAAG